MAGLERQTTSAHEILRLTAYRGNAHRLARGCWRNVKRCIITKKGEKIRDDEDDAKTQGRLARGQREGLRKDSRSGEFVNIKRIKSPRRVDRRN